MLVLTLGMQDILLITKAAGDVCCLSASRRGASCTLQSAVSMPEALCSAHLHACTCTSASVYICSVALQHMKLLFNIGVLQN